MLSEKSYLFKKLLSMLVRRDGIFKLPLCGRTYLVKYEAHHIRAERDYKVMKALGAGRNCIYDVGSNVGLSVLMLSAENQAEIHAFEASEFGSKLTIDHAQLNGVGERVRVINSLVAERSGNIIPFFWDYSSGGASIFEGRLGHTYAINKVTVSLDDYSDQSNAAPDLIKIDVEGAELEVLRGAVRILKKCRPIIFLELHSVKEEPLWVNAGHVIDFIAGYGYEMNYLRTREVVTNPRILEDRGRCHVMLAPAGTDWDTVLAGVDTKGL